MLKGSKWSQYDDGWDQTDRDLNIDYNRIQLIEENTNYKFTTGQKLNAELEDLRDNINEAVKTNWSILKFAPIILLGALVYKVVK